MSFTTPARAAAPLHDGRREEFQCLLRRDRQRDFLQSLPQATPADESAGDRDQCQWRLHRLREYRDGRERDADQSRRAVSTGRVATLLSSKFDRGQQHACSQGGEVAGAKGSSLRFHDTSTAGSATILTLGSLVGGGGYTRFDNSSSGGNAAFITEGNGLFDISFLASGTTAGSIAGSGTYSLGAKLLTVGSLNTDTEVSGSISGTGGT